MEHVLPDIVILTGPTGSGKSVLGAEIAKRINGEVINSDSVQVYREIQKISFAPIGPLEVEHHLYGFVGCDEYFSVAKFLLAARSCIEAVIKRGAVPVFVGGSPMYQRLMVDGISQIPSSRHVLSNATEEQRAAPVGGQPYNTLVNQDPSVADLVHPNDSYRILKAFNAVQAGVSLSELGNLPKLCILAPYRPLKLCLLPRKELVYANCASRINTLNREEIVDEASALMKLNLPPHYPAQKAIGVPEMKSFLCGEISMQEAFEKILLRTRHYVKRQYTWFNNKYSDFTLLGHASVAEAVEYLFEDTPLRYLAELQASKPKQSTSAVSS